MALDGILLHRYQQSIKEVLPLKINRITQLSDHEIVFHCFSHKKVTLYVSLHAQTNRLQLLEQLVEKSNSTSNFLDLLKKTCEPGKLVAINQIGFDRIVKLDVESKNELFETVQTCIYIELMGKYANMVLVDSQNKVIDALYRIAPYQNSKRILIPTATYVEVDSLNKKSPLEYKDESPDTLMENFEGFSPILAREFEYRMLNGENYHDILQDIQTSNTLYVAKEKPGVFHAIELKHTLLEFDQFELHKGLTHIYQSLDYKKRIKDVTNNVEKIIKRELKKARSKKEKLEIEKTKIEDASFYKECGDYCFMFAHEIGKGTSFFEAIRFDDQSTFTIKLDPRLSAIENGQSYYKKYQKVVSSIPHLDKQIQLVEEKISYFSQLSEQIEYSDIADALEIKEELANQGYFSQEKQKKNNKKKTPNIIKIMFDENTMIYVGKNNIQNDYVTFTLASKKDVWFHTRHHHGAHVVVSSKIPLEEPQIRAAANLAAYYSKARHSSSVEVMYTNVSNIKKIPQAAKGMVSVMQYQSIFIDPESAIIEKILQKN